MAPARHRASRRPDEPASPIVAATRCVFAGGMAMTNRPGSGAGAMALLSAVLFAIVPATSVAVGPGSDGGSTGFANADSPPGQRAISRFREGEEQLDRARALRIEIVELREGGGSDAAKVAELEADERGTYERAEPHFREAIELDEGLFQAWSSLGYTLRRLGRFDEAIPAYDRAIELEPRYVEAVEYRAEAYLQLGRLDETRNEYERLAGWVEPYAARLMAKMEAWHEAKLADPGDFDPAELAEFGRWLAERKASGEAPASASARQRAEW
jgi:tetratricopeptide (TPR) repeat protein